MNNLHKIKTYLTARTQTIIIRESDTHHQLKTYNKYNYCKYTYTVCQ